ncbi:MAG: M24 family metallopeptidase [Alphaproteobacteria bacterium]|nr:M24 family metallopeptidase [Alphaproteobacteria bacterium]
MAFDMERLKEIPNGERVEGTFTAAEMARRQDGLRGILAELNLDAAILTSYHGINYYSDFLYCRFGRRYALVVTPDRVVSVSANIDGGQPWRRTVGENLVYTDWRRDNWFHALQTLLPGAKRLGIEFDHVDLDTRRLLGEAFEGAAFIDVAAASMRQRMIKSDEEIALIKQGARIADLGGAACAEAIGVGVPEHEVALHATQAMVREIARTYPDAELMDTWTWFQSGLNTDGAHNPVTSRRIERGDILSLNCFPMIAGYYTALERTLFAEQVSDAHQRYWDINLEVYHAGLALIRPGARCCDIAHELNAIYDRHGVLDKRTFGYGHSFGVLSHYYGREAGLELREDVETVLEPNMVVSIEPMITIPGGEPGAGGYREHDILVVTEDGADNITGFPVGSEKNIIRAG